MRDPQRDQNEPLQAGQSHADGMPAEAAPDRIHPYRTAKGELRMTNLTTGRSSGSVAQSGSLGSNPALGHAQTKKKATIPLAA